MRYALNLPLILGCLCLSRVLWVMTTETSLGGGDRAMGTAFELFFGTVFGWLFVGIAVVACGAMGGYRWPATHGFAGAGAAFLAFGAIVFVAILAIGISMEFNTSGRWTATHYTIARIAAFGLPFAMAAYAAWIIDAPAEIRGVPSVHGGFLGAIGFLCILAATASVLELARWDRAAQANSEARRQEEDTQAQQIRRDMAALPEDATLFQWNAYLWYNVPDDVREEALRRVAARPQLEAELAEGLASENPNWSLACLKLVQRIPYKPTQAIGPPVQDAIDRYTAELAKTATDPSFDGDQRIDRYETYNLRSVLEVSEYLADSAGIDLRPAIDGAVKAVAAYPKSGLARSFPGDAAAVKARIGEILARRHG